MVENELDDSFKLTLYQIHRKVLELAISGGGLVASMELLCQEIEQILKDQGGLCSILLLDGQYLKHCAAPSLPQAYCYSIDGVKIGEGAGSCGTALYRQKQVIVTDIASDPLWRDYRDLARRNGLGACWSNPIIACDGKPLASFAIYYPVPFSPSSIHLYLIEAFSALALLVIDHYRMSEEQIRLSGELKKINARLGAIIQVMPDVAILLDKAGHYVDFFGNTAQLFSSQKTLLGKSVNDNLEPDLASQIIDTVEKTLITGQMQELEYELKSEGKRSVFEGRTAIVDDFDIEGKRDRYVLWMARDITTRKLAEEDVARLALFDILTGLPNRRHAQEQLEQLLEEVNRGHSYGAVMFLDLNDFKRINDSLGHYHGDQLLRQVAQRLEDNTRRSEIVARLGGDEFVILLRQPRSDSEALFKSIATAANRILGCFNEPLETNDNLYNISASVGIAIANEPGIKAEDLLRRADAAMYAAKRQGGNRFAFFEDSLQLKAHLRLDLEQRMAESIKRKHFVTYFQLQVKPDGTPFGAEALLRWFDPEKGAIPPDAFIPVAESSGFIHQLQDIVLEQSCSLLAKLREQNLLPPGFRLAINVSPMQFESDLLTERLNFFLNYFELTADHLTLEITETLLMSHEKKTCKQLQALRQQGLRLSIDDFGTGYSSLAYLHRLNVDQLKVDKSFIHELEEGAVGEAIVDSVIALSNSLDLEVIIEGVETEKQHGIISNKAVSGAQGYLYARPLNINDFIGNFPRSWRRNAESLPPSL